MTAEMASALQSTPETDVIVYGNLVGDMSWD